MIEVKFGRPARMHLIAEPLLRDRLNRLFQEAENSAEEVIHEMGDELLEDGDLSNAPMDLLESTDEDAPIIRLVNRILFQAVRDRASDIHIEPMEEELVVRFRIDGILYPVLRPPRQLQAAVTSRVKIMA
ncbi:MAG: type II secretion system protein GspE, partial [Candidatus Dadabacteria bacterium]